MTKKEIKLKRKEVPRFNNGKPLKLSKEQELIHVELDCREMINSCLCYGYDFIDSRYSMPYIQKLGNTRVMELYNEQKEDFSKAKVLKNVYEDGEGVSYNSIQWEDELEID